MSNKACPVTGEFCLKLATIEAKKDKSPINGRITIEDHLGTLIKHTEDDPYEEHHEVVKWA